MMDDPMLSPTSLKCLSVKVCKVLDDVGVSEEVRKRCMEMAVYEEVIGTVIARFQGANFTCYIFGSSSEGTKTMGLMSDVDNLISQDLLEVFQTESEIRVTDSRPDCLLLVCDPHTKPGYAKLQLIIDGALQKDVIPDLGVPPNKFQLDSNGRVVCTKRYYYASMNDEEHGPAFSTPAEHGYSAKDMVQAYRCRKWPEAAMKWFERIKGKKWPTQEMLDEMKLHGFFLVPVGHSSSPEQNMEWRISLSKQERILMVSLNPTQHKCYVLLKMIKKDSLPVIIGADSLTSYHCKTCLFYVVEETNASDWTSDNILPCLRRCLQYLLDCATKGVCPNYFIPEENMFDGRISEETLSKLRVALEKLLSSNFKFLMHITSDKFGERLHKICITTDSKETEISSMHAERTERSTIHDNGTESSTAYGEESESSTMDEEETESSRCHSVKLSIYMKIYSQLTVARNSILSACSSTAPDRVIQMLLGALKEINVNEKVAEHSKEETTKALKLLTPYIELSLMSLMVTQASEKEERGVVWDCLVKGNWTELKQSSDLLSGPLKQATMMFKLGFAEESLDILEYMLELISYPSYQVSALTHRNMHWRQLTVRLKHFIEAGWHLVWSSCEEKFPSSLRH